MKGTREDNFFVDGYVSAKTMWEDAGKKDASGDRLPYWNDPVRMLHMRTESDIVLIFGGVALE